MNSPRTVLWEVDAQVDFMLPGGKLYVPGAEKILPNIQRLVDAARETKTLVVSSRCAHSENDPEFETFPPHCIRGTAGAEIVPEGMLHSFRVLANDPKAQLPADILNSPQIIIEKQMLDVFSNPHTAEIVGQLGNARYVVLGVVTEYCVQCAAKGLLARGREVAIVQDAIETLKPEEGHRVLEELQGQGAKLVSADEAIGMLRA
jgi:nicotinamidase/pyrazinamidase